MSNAPVTDATQTTESQANARRRTLPVVRAVLAVLLLATVLAWNGNGPKALDILQRLPPQWLPLLLTLSFAVNWISMLKWRLILRERGTALPRLMLMRLYLIGKFISNFTPGMIGGDVARTIMLGRASASASRAAASIVIERLTGLATLVMLVAVTAVVDTRIMQRPLASTAVICATLVCGAVLLVMISTSVRQWWLAVARAMPRLRRVASWLASLQTELAAFPRCRRMILGTLAYSIAFYAVCSLSVYAAAHAVGLQVPYRSVALLTPALYLIAAIPVSTNNLGWWEWCFSIVLLDVGATPAQGLAVGLTLRLVTLIVSLVGGLCLLTGGRGVSRSPHETRGDTAAADP